MMKASQKNRQVEDQLCQINDGFCNKKKKKKEKDISKSITVKPVM